MRLAYANYLDVIVEEADLVDALAEPAAERRVPACAGETVADLLARLEACYRYWNAQLLAKHPEAEHEPPGAAPLSSPPRRRGGAPATVLDAAEALAATLGEVGEESPCWNWSEEEHQASWVARRLALESTLRRVDVQASRGLRRLVDAELALDGIEERLAVVLPAQLAGDEVATLGGSLCLICSDVPAAWRVEVERGQLSFRHGRAPADTALVGSVSELFLFTWNRSAERALSITGDRDVASAWRCLGASHS